MLISARPLGRSASAGQTGPSSTPGRGGSGCDTGCGVVFKLTPNGSQYTETVLHEFAGGDDGADPYAGLYWARTGTSSALVWRAAVKAATATAAVSFT